MAKKKTVLIVEDESSLLQLLASELEEEGLNVLQAPDGKIGLKLALKEHPDLVLLDLIMPVMDGMEMCKRLREDEWGKNVEVMILTNLSDAESASTAMDLNVSGYLVKADWELADVIKKIKAKLKVK